MRGFVRLLLPIIVIVLLSTTTGWADREGMPFPRVTTSYGGRSYFKMFPTGEWPDIDYTGEGICYAVMRGEKDEVLWRTTGWYAYEVYLTENGEYLVRMGNWARGDSVSHKQLAVAFYKHGELLKDYSTKDLVRNPSAIRTSVSHYRWTVSTCFDPMEKTFTIVTTDSVEYIFDVTTGEITLDTKLIEPPPDQFEF